MLAPSQDKLCLGFWPSEAVAEVPENTLVRSAVLEAKFCPRPATGKLLFIWATSVLSQLPPHCGPLCNACNTRGRIILRNDSLPQQWSNQNAQGYATSYKGNRSQSERVLEPNPSPTPRPSGAEAGGSSHCSHFTL